MIAQLSHWSASSAVLGEVRVHACWVRSPAVQTRGQGGAIPGYIWLHVGSGGTDWR